MSREEAIANLEMIRVAFGVPVTKEQRKLIDDTFDMAIQALSQQPCDDAISRESVDRILRDMGVNCAYDMPSFWANKGKDYKVIPTKWHKGYQQAVADFDKRISELPSVTPKSETVTEFADRCRECGARYGKLLKQKSWEWIDHSYDEGYVECPFCGHLTTCEDNIDELHYCFYCGAKMESEDKE